ncbi:MULTISPECIES: glycerol kinase GlpK [Legionella]|uniref:Glycerol kinase n=1 Tax=Legionella steelei TaxID=947033 RepID=A0A0W0ZFW9_9GAMM|nr:MULTISPECIES: glycerol kinase GlpK [Legionella]KTD68079.1 glycerol kinase [Legionella steelei]MBN9228658.1 glycerol kinase GlpK [Legionella steelei]OJW11933.1 MAG: glycerol kinase [Legionella sp. 39-23]
MNYLLAIDQGTSSTRVMVYTVHGELVTSSQYPLTQYYPQTGWVEHDPEEIWEKTLAAMRDVLSRVPVEQIVTCGLTNQRETTVIWNKKTGACLAPAIVWQDRRTAEYCKTLVVNESMIQEKTGLVPDPYFSATKLKWLLENNSEAKELADKGDLAFGTIDSFLIWRLTKERLHLTDVTNASRTMLFNIKEEQWDLDLLDYFRIPESVLPKVCASDSHFGLIDKQWLGIELPITGVAGDQQAALIGQGCFNIGMVKATFGTGAFLLLNTGNKAVLSQHKLLTTIAYKIKGQTVYGLEGSIYHAGTTVKWLRDSMKLIAHTDETEVLAGSLNGNEGVYFVSSFTGLGAPHWLSVPGASMVGLSLSSNKAHFARAALEGVCYQTREVCLCMREDSQLDLSLLRVDGGMAVNRWFLQFLADQCQLQIQKPKDIETTAKGAAILAALGCGVYNSLDELHAIWDVEQTFNPQRSLEQVEMDYRGWKQALQKVKG